MASESERPRQKPPTTPQEWEVLIEDFQNGGKSLEKWSGILPAILDQSLLCLVKKDFPGKSLLLIFLDEFSSCLFTGGESDLLRYLDTLRFALQSPVDGPITSAYQFKEQFMISATSVFISAGGVDGHPSFAPRAVEGLVETLLVVINRPNHGPDRNSRGVACECLRQLEKEHPCLLAGVAGHVWSLCQIERTHAFQSYLLLFATIVYNIVKVKPNVSILNNSLPLVPFTFPKWEPSCLNIKELRRALAFLLESPHILTPCGMAELLGLLMPMTVSLELQASMLKVQFFGMIYSFDPLLCHIVLMLYSHFPDAFDDMEALILTRLMLVSRENHHHLVFRMLALHWSLGLLSRCLLDKNFLKFKDAADQGLRFYPEIFDPLALKSLKFDLLVFWSLWLETMKSKTSLLGHLPDVKPSDKLFKDSLVSVSGFKWLPHWSRETAVAFRSLHKFLIGFSSHSSVDLSGNGISPNSITYQIVEEVMIEMTLNYPRLVPNAFSLIDRLLCCKIHNRLGERLLLAVNERLLPRVHVDSKLVSYFPLLDKVAYNAAISPQRLLDLLMKFMIFLVKQHGPSRRLKSWSEGSKVLAICRTMLVHHYRSRLFIGLSHLLSFTCLYFPDLEVRDNARIYLRMLICVPGAKLRGILNLSEQLFGGNSSKSLFNVQSPRNHQNMKKSRNILSYFHIKRQIPVLVKQCWSLTLPNSVCEIDEPDHPDDRELPTDVEEEKDSMSTDRFIQSDKPLLVMDSKISDILVILRIYFSCIPDIRNVQRYSVRVPCTLSFDAEPFNKIWGDGITDSSQAPAIFAAVLKFSSSAPYGSIPSYHIPFLLGELRNGNPCEVTESLDLVTVENGCTNSETCTASVMIDLIPKEPTPGFIDVSLEANTENGQIIRGQLPGVGIGIEDMFTRAAVPAEILQDAIPAYYSNLFEALWVACDASSSIGREPFFLQGGKASAVINGTRSVKLLETPAATVIRAVERYLELFVVTVSGEELVNIVKDEGIIRNATWKDAISNSYFETTASDGRNPLCLTYTDDNATERELNFSTRIIGHFQILIFLPPRYHLLFLMEVSAASTLVRIRTDWWPCLAYVDDYLEALVSS